jgi:outer membrane lipoprotein-sorting protein
LTTHRFAEELDAAKSTISLLLKDDNKVRVELTMRMGGRERRGNIISDGSKLRIRFDSGDTQETPAATRVLWNRMLVRTGLMVGTFLFQDSVGNGKTVDPKDFLPVSDVKKGDDDGTAKTLTFTVTLGGNDTAEVRLWYDPITFRIQKRTVLAKSKGKPDQGSISETYEDFTLNAEIPDEKFKLPEEKK